MVKRVELRPSPFWPEFTSLSLLDSWEFWKCSGPGSIVMADWDHK